MPATVEAMEGRTSTFYTWEECDLHWGTRSAHLIGQIEREAAEYQTGGNVGARAEYAKDGRGVVLHITW